jgi:hypothetical protein
VNGTVYTASIERGNNQIGVITLWKREKPDWVSNVWQDTARHLPP